jgi:hypothetical protein
VRYRWRNDSAGIRTQGGLLVSFGEEATHSHAVTQLEEVTE